MKIGLGIPGNMISQDNLRFARQAGATHIVAHLVSAEAGHPLERQGYRVSVAGDRRYGYEALRELREAVEAEGLTLEAIENFAPADWSDILLDGPGREEQLTNLKRQIHDLGRAGIPVMGYNFSLAGVWGRHSGPYARGGAETVAFDDPVQPPIPEGMIWNMVYDPDHFDPQNTTRVLAPVSPEELWRRFEAFLVEMVPAAEEAGVKLALHPDDPPMPILRDTARLVHRPELYQRVLDMYPSDHNCMEFCIGTLSEMPGSDIYEVVDRYSRTGRIAYVHFRNVVGTVPHYREVFVDEGDTDMLRLIRILAANNYSGVLIPDHTPRMTCEAPWHAGMAYALGWMRAAALAVGALE